MSIEIEIEIVLDYQIGEACDVLLQVEVAQMADQRIVGDRLTVTSPEPLRPVPGLDGIGQRSWARGQGVFLTNYSAIVAVDRPAVDLATLVEIPARRLPGEAAPYLLPSRYVEADRFETFVGSRFGHLAGGPKLVAMLDWFGAEMAYVIGSSDGDTGAAQTFVKRQGVCRDYAHLFAAFARAAHIPARVASVYAPNVLPSDFHAVVELFLSDAWHLVDPTGMADPQEMVRIGVGRDATDIAFMTVLGSAQLMDQRVEVNRV